MKETRNGRTHNGEEGERVRDRREALLEELVRAQQRELEQQRERREVRLATLVGHAARRPDVRERRLAGQRAVARLCAAKVVLVDVRDMEEEDEPAMAHATSYEVSVSASIKIDVRPLTLT